jgi:tetratricopeptide (TPR) repeat protein
MIFTIGANENMQECLTIYEKTGKFEAAGNLKKKSAEEYENEGNYAQAILEYQKAISYYSMDSTKSKTNENNCMIKLADLMCRNDHPDAFNEAKVVINR